MREGSLLCNAGRALENGQGVLADGTQFDRQSGEEHGPNGYWFRWHRLKGKSGKVVTILHDYMHYYLMRHHDAPPHALLSDALLCITICCVSI